MDSRKYFLAGIALLAMAGGAWMSWQVLRTPPQLQAATLLPSAAALPEFELIDDSGNAFSRSDFGGQWNLVFFGFTHCPDVCPLTLQVLADARQRMQAAGIENLPRIVLVSVDPERDSAEVMRLYMAHFGEGAIGITGTLPELRKLTGNIGIYFEKSGDDTENYTVDHSAVVVVIDADARFHALFGAPQDAAQIAHDMPILMSVH